MKQTDTNPLHTLEEKGEPDLHGAELELLNTASKASGRSLAFWARLTEGLDEKALALLASRARMVSPELPASGDGLQQDQKETVALLSLVGQRDRQVFLRALRSLVDLRTGQQN
ncbi:hypothetical protein [Leisingera sp. JC11]|uniref:hypothetical protein n=1 Tax=Leisingera sp. JC11 TaxID=3042469 RepID=UPI0034570E49